MYKITIVHVTLFPPGSGCFWVGQTGEGGDRFYPG